MNLSSTPRAKNPRKRFLSPVVSSPYRSPLVKSLPEKKVLPEIQNISFEELKASTKELWEKNKNLTEQIQDLQKKGYKEEDLNWYIDKFHEYNEIKDVAQNVMGRLAILDEVTTKAVHEEFGMAEND